MLYSFLSSSDLKKIHQFQNELPFLQTRQQLIDYTLRSIKAIFAIDFVGWNEMMAHKGAFLDAHVYPRFPENVTRETFEPMVSLMPTHPLINHFYKFPRTDLKTLAYDEVVPFSTYVDSPIYREVYDKFEARHLLFFHMPGGIPSRVFLTLTRKHIPFKQQEKALLDCIGQATARKLMRLPAKVAHIRIINELCESLESDAENFLQLNHELQVVNREKQIHPLFRLFFPDEKLIQGLPDSLRSWLHGVLVDERTGIQTIGITIKRSTVFRRWNRNLIVIWIKRPSDRHSFLSLQEDLVAKTAYESEIRQLTRRQRQVYHLMKDGISDVETIAQQMGIAKRTAEGHRMHVQQILQTLS